MYTRTGIKEYFRKLKVNVEILVIIMLVLENVDLMSSILKGYDLSLRSI